MDHVYDQREENSAKGHTKHKNFYKVKNLVWIVFCFSGEEYNFNKYSHNLVDLLKLNYDYDSIMHYGRYSFSANKNPTIQAVGDPDKEMGQRNTFTAIDKMKLDILYDCKSKFCVVSNFCCFPWG